MEFNIPKCVHLPITNQTKPNPDYIRIPSMVCHSPVSNHPYTGIKLDTKLTWANHITFKSSTVLGIIKQTTGPCKPDVIETACNTLVRPELEHTSTLRNPHTTTKIKHLEKVQHCAARFVKNDHLRQTVTTDLIATLERRKTNKPWHSTKYKYYNQHHTTTGPIKTTHKPGPLYSHQVPHQHCSVLLFPSNSHLEYDPTTHYYNTPIAFQAATMNLSSTTPNYLNCLLNKQTNKQINKQTTFNLASLRTVSKTLFLLRLRLCPSTPSLHAAAAAATHQHD